MELSDWWAETTSTKDEWRCVCMDAGALCATTAGTVVMLPWSVDNLVTPHVRIYPFYMTLSSI